MSSDTILFMVWLIGALADIYTALHPACYVSQELRRRRFWERFGVLANAMVIVGGILWPLFWVLYHIRVVADSLSNGER